ncbi:MAG: Na+/H+ antiporter NhaA, partial [Solirubrobacteraceae bacterium]
VLIYLAINSGDGASHGWGAAMSTDTAFALGVLALVGPRYASRLRAFIVTVVVVDDLIALIVIATVYTDQLDVVPLLVGFGFFGVVLALRRARVTNGAWYALMGVATWLALHDSGVDPVIVGLAMGLLTYAYPASRDDLEEATDLFRQFREQPTPELARSASARVTSTISANERMAQKFHPWSSYVIVPLFALANAGIVLNGDTLERGLHSPITLGIVVGYVVGKPVGIFVASFLVCRLSRGRFRAPVGWGSILGGGAAAGIGFTVSLLIASRAFDGADLAEAKLGILGAAACASLLSLLVFRGLAALPETSRIRALDGTTGEYIDLATPIDPDEDHIRGNEDAAVTLVEYGDFECPYCGQAESAVRELLRSFGADLRYAFRHLPLADVHPNAQMAAEASEAAAAQGRFWEMHDALFDHQDALTPAALRRYAQDLGLDVERFWDEVRTREHAPRVAEDVRSADESGVAGTPTFFINGRRHQGAYDVDTLTTAVRRAHARARLAAAA